MKYSVTFFIVCLIVCFCQILKDPGNGWQEMETEFNAGNFRKVSHLADSLKMVFPGDSLLINRLDSMKEMTRRIALDFSITEPKINVWLQEVMGNFTPEDKRNWENQNLLEWRLIDGEKRYFNRAASNLKLILAHQQKKLTPSAGYSPDETALFRINHAENVNTLGSGQGTPVHPVNIWIKYRLTVDPDAVGAGEMIRCWLPFPREVHPRQKNIRLISTIPAEHFIAPDIVGQRSLYMEQKAVKGQSALFEMELSYQSFAQYFDLLNFKIKPYETGSSLYSEYTREEKPHILFSENIRKLSDSIVGEEKNPAEIVRRIFYWIDENIPWAGALEYSIMPNIPEYVIQNRHGDCGMQTLLFIALARYNGIPAKWQSGWMLPPGNVNLHDWCEVYYEGVGWVPLDMSYGRLPAENGKIRDFYMSGIDAYRMIVNDATGTPFIPARKFMRSEPVDFQRGEVEWREGNLYFDKWRYSMEVAYF